MARIVLFAASADPSLQVRLVSVAESLAHAGIGFAVISPVGLPQTTALEGVRHFHARRREDASFALARLGADGPVIVECFDPAATRCAAAWRDAQPAGPANIVVLADAEAVRAEPAIARVADAAIAGTQPQADLCVDAGFDAERVFVARGPVQPRAVFAPGSNAVLCLTPIAPDRGLIELIDAWAASGCGTDSDWVLRFGGLVDDNDFAQHLARRAASCPGVCLTERLGPPDAEIATSAVLIDPDGSACPRVLHAVARSRAVFAPAGSATADAACEPQGPFAFPTDRGIHGLISVFDRVGGHQAADMATPGNQARDHLLRRHAFAHAMPARRDAYERASGLAPRATTPGVGHQTQPASAPGDWVRYRHGNQCPNDTQRLERAFLACHSQGYRRVALYGAGAFVKRCADALCDPQVDVVGFIDDDERRRGRRMFGYPILCPDVALTADLDAVILTAPSFEEQLWQRTAWFRDAGIRVIPLDREHAEIFQARAA